MSKIKTQLTEQGCAMCGLLYPLARAELGYDTCTTCGELQAADPYRLRELHGLSPD